MDWNDDVCVGPATIEEALTHLRWVMQDGEKVLQYPVLWTRGAEGGIRWVDVPVDDEIGEGGCT